ncbi:MAG: phage tail protein [Boseongicola sp.]
MEADKRNDPYRTHHYEVLIDGMIAGGFSEVSSPNMRREIVEYRNGNDPESHSRKLTGRDSFENITLKRGFTHNAAFMQWFANLSMGADDRRNITITLRDEARRPVLTWVCEGAWIVSLMGPGFNAAGNEVAIESIEFAVESVKMELEATPA